MKNAQKLSGRDTYTPTSVSQARGNCDVSLNSPSGVMDSAARSKTPDNISDANLTGKRTPGRVQGNTVPVVYVLNTKGDALMPTSPRKARVLLRSSRAKVVKRTPFTIQLLYDVREAKQPVSLGVDSGYKSVGLSAVTDEKEVYSAEVMLRDDIVKLISQRRQYRRARRGRKTWYRKPRFLNRKRPEGWLAPSIQNKLDAHVKAIKQVAEILPVTEVIVEVASFDIQKIKNPDIEGEEYQEGSQKGFWNVREYVLHRDNHTCQVCHGKSGDRVLQVHHMESRQTGGDRPDNLLTTCETCHKGISAGEITLTATPKKGFRPETFVTTVRWKLVDRLREEGFSVSHTFGYITKGKRIEMGLPKSHVNDAFVIAGGGGQTRSSSCYLIKQVRSCNRKLYRGARSHIRNTSPQPICGYNRYDKVLWNDAECFVFGRRLAGYFDIRKLDGTKIHASAKVKDLTLLECANTLLAERNTALLPALKDGVSGPG